MPVWSAEVYRIQKLHKMFHEKEKPMDMLTHIKKLEQELADLKRQIREIMPRVEWCYTQSPTGGCFYKIAGDPGKQHPARSTWRVFAVPILNSELIEALEKIIDEDGSGYRAKSAETEDES